MKYKRGKKSKKEFIKEKLYTIFKSSRNKKEFESNLEKSGFTFYKRGKSNGVKFNNKSYRFKTLGFDMDYSKFSQEQSRANTCNSKSSFTHERSK
jgi:hypothetical protein